MNNAASRRRKQLFVGIVALVTTAAALAATLAFARIVTRTKTVAVTANTKQGVTAKCPKGKSVVMGGFHNVIASDLDPKAYLIGLARTSTGRGWKDSAVNWESSSSANATAIAYCGQGRKLKPHTDTVDVPRPATGVSTATATCPRGQRVALGGFSASWDTVITPGYSQVFVSGLRRTSQRKWQASGINRGDNPSVGTLTAIAYCAHKAPKTAVRSKTTSVPSQNTRGAVTAKCRKGERLAFGGFSADVTASAGPFVIIDRLARTSGRRWSAEAINTHNGANTPGDLTAFAYCT